MRKAGGTAQDEHTGVHSLHSVRAEGRRRRWSVRVLQWLALVALALGGTATEARLQPYHVIKSLTHNEVQPRILFVLDTSGSMGWTSVPGDTPCNWPECESAIDTPAESRISAARRVIHEIVESNKDQAKFALMTFDQLGPHTGGTPATCTSGRRFRWSDRYASPTESGWSPWRYIEQYEGYVGAWKLCQGSAKRPFPYLRWDELGVGSVIHANHAVGDPPPSPLISTAQADMTSDENATRRVQWFPRFMGVRWQPNDDTDPGRTITHASVGDYASTIGQKDTQVWQHDFYYWPYVDGFPGYSAWLARPYGTHESFAGVIGAPNDGWLDRARLYAPFYLDLGESDVPVELWGPKDEEEAARLALDATSPTIRGGVDAIGSTPWRSVVGEIPAVAEATNDLYSHDTVASYVRFLKQVNTPDSCAPTAVVLLSDGVPMPANTEGGPELYRRLAALRKELGVPVYVVGMFLDAGEINDMACAAAGACDGGFCNNPCQDEPADAWDTCFEPGSPTTSCAFVAENTADLKAALADIVHDVLTVDVQTGQDATVNEYGSAMLEQGEAVQTTLHAFTEVPLWRGHVVRDYCQARDEADELLPHCVPPNPEFGPSEEQPTFGPCPQSRSWDAGECLKVTPWNERRLFTHDENNEIVPIADADGAASDAFIAELQGMNLLAGEDEQAEADAIAAFVLGRDAPHGWKLPGLANSTPVVVRRIPKYDHSRVPEVAIRDPHCGGRLYPLTEQGALPKSLQEFAERAWDESDPESWLAAPAPHHAYQEAVLVGDDMGVLHAFQLDSGNELWGFLPRALLPTLAQQAAIGPGTMGQPEGLDDHIYGIAATVNHAWIPDPGVDEEFDTPDDTWRHLAVFGFGAGGPEYVALDLSHMSPMASKGPFEILWTTEDAELKAAYDAINGETWARPAITYWVPGDDLASLPEAYVVMGSGYRVEGGAPTEQGRTLVRARALDGTIEDQALLPDVSHAVYEQEFGAVVDASVGSHCISRFWAESQETYIADPAGRLFRWDLGRDTAHEADSGGPWNGSAKPVSVGALDHFPACRGMGDTCSVDPSGPADVFVLSAAVTSNDRIDDVSSVMNGVEPGGQDQFLVALVSGSSYEDKIDGFVHGQDFHSSIYLLVDDHSQDKGGGFEIPDGAPKSTDLVGAGAELDEGEAGYLRIALTDIERTRTVIPYEGASPYEETRRFSRQTRPLRSPRILVTGVIEPGEAPEENTVIDGVEVYFVEFTVFEPPTAICNPAFYDPETDTHHRDVGSSFVLTFRLTADLVNGFNFQTGTQNESVDFGAGFTRGLVLESVEQVSGAACPSGNCGPQGALAGAGTAPCAPPEGMMPGGMGRFAVPVRSAQIHAFSPIE
jgi:hypothetical protein